VSNPLVQTPLVPVQVTTTPRFERKSAKNWLDAPFNAVDLSNELSRKPESEPDPAVMASIYGPDTTVIDRSDRLICSFPPNGLSIR
jgi:hypothetical protein